MNQTATAVFEPDVVDRSLTLRLAFIAATTVVAWPSRWAMYWGGRTEGDVALVAVFSLTWALLTWLSARRRTALAGRSAELLLFADVVALTALLAMSGAAQNPFSMLYFVPITWATLVAPQWTLGVALAAVLGFATLLLLTAIELGPHQHHPGHAHFFHHVVGMAVALAIAGAFITYLVRRIGRVLDERRQALLLLARERERNQLTVALGAMAAGAAHELGGPLGTVQMLAEEWAHLTEVERGDGLSTIVGQVKRMKGILQGLQSSELNAEQLRSEAAWQLDELQSEVAPGVVVQIDSAHATKQPKSVLAQMLRELVNNALVAADATRIEVRLSSDERAVTLSVRDHGRGVTQEQLAHIREPFISFRGGTGLGLFLVQVHAQQLGGSLDVQSEYGAGFLAEVRLPIDPPARLESRSDDG